MKKETLPFGFLIYDWIFILLSMFNRSSCWKVQLRVLNANVHKLLFLILEPLIRASKFSACWEARQILEFKSNKFGEKKMKCIDQSHRWWRWWRQSNGCGVDSLESGSCWFSGLSGLSGDSLNLMIHYLVHAAWLSDCLSDTRALSYTQPWRPAVSCESAPLSYRFRTAFLVPTS